MRGLPVRAGEGYRELLRPGAAADHDVDALRTELQAWLVAREQQVAPHIRARTGEADTDVTLRADVLCMEQRWGEALAIVQAPARCWEVESITLHNQLTD